MRKIYIVAAKRTPIGKFLGSLATVSAADMAAIVIKNIVDETKIDPSTLDEVIVGNILMAGQGQGIARQASIKAGVPNQVPAYGVNMICGSGMKSIMMAVSAIRAGDAELILAGGTESMSGSGFVLPGTARNGYKMGNITMLDHMVLDGLTDAFSGLHMGITAENVAEKFNISREEQDAFSLTSQTKAIDAIDNGRFKDEIVPVEIITRKSTVVFDTDEYPNRTTNAEKLTALRPAFKKDGTVTAGNASGINDGAAFLLIASEDYIKTHKLKPLAEIVACGQSGVDPAYMGIAPVSAIANTLKKAEMKLADMGLIELNEAFASQSVGVMKELCVDHNVSSQWLDERTNVNGGAIALGHPIGSSGSRIVVSLIYEMHRRKVNFGLASLCIGGGMGTALILKNIQ